jgi:hypothetical protein
MSKTKIVLSLLTSAMVVTTVILILYDRRRGSSHAIPSVDLILTDTGDHLHEQLLSILTYVDNPTVRILSTNPNAARRELLSEKLSTTIEWVNVPVGKTETALFLDLYNPQSAAWFIWLGDSVCIGRPLCMGTMFRGGRIRFEATTERPPVHAVRYNDEILGIATTLEEYISGVRTMRTNVVICPSMVHTLQFIPNHPAWNSMVHAHHRGRTYSRIGVNGMFVRFSGCSFSIKEVE